MLDAAAALLTYQASIYFTTGEPQGRMGNRHPSIAPYDTFEAADGEFVLAVGHDAQFARLVRASPSSSRLRAIRGSRPTPDASGTTTCCVPRWRDVFRARTRAEWIATLTRAGVPAGSVRDVGEVLRDPQLLHRAMIETVGSLDCGPDPATRTAGEAVRHARRHPPAAADTWPAYGWRARAAISAWTRRRSHGSGRRGWCERADLVSCREWRSRSCGNACATASSRRGSRRARSREPRSADAWGQLLQQWSADDAAVSQVLKSEGTLPRVHAGRHRAAGRPNVGRRSHRMALDTAGAVPVALRAGQPHARPRAVHDEHILASGDAIPALTDERLLDLLTSVLGPFLER